MTEARAPAESKTRLASLSTRLDGSFGLRSVPLATPSISDRGGYDFVAQTMGEFTSLTAEAGGSYA